MWHVETDVFALAVFIVLLVRNHKLRTEHTQQDRIYNAILWVSIYLSSVTLSLQRR